MLEVSDKEVLLVLLGLVMVDKEVLLVLLGLVMVDSSYFVVYTGYGDIFHPPLGG